MKESELQIGDFVYAGIYLRDPNHMPEITQIPVKVIGIGNNVVVEYIVENTIKNHIFPLDMLIPIQLTAEIFEKNGYKKLHYEFNGNIDEPYEIITPGWRTSYNFDYGWGYVISNEYTFGGKITYVHELQNALRLCGLNELADNFKI